MKKQFTIFLIPIFIFSLYLLFANSAKADTCSSFTYSDWSVCTSNGQQTRTVITSSPDGCTDGNPVLTQTCTYNTPVCTSWTYSEWGACQLRNEWDQGSGYQARTTTTLSPEGCVFYHSSPLELERRCLLPCTANDYECFEWSTCSKEGIQIKNCRLKQRSYNCGEGSEQPQTTQVCTYTPPRCTSFYYSSWSECSQDGKQTRNITSTYPSDCEGGVSPVTTLSCTYSQPPINSGSEYKCGQITKNIKFWINYDTAPLEDIFTGMAPSEQEKIRTSRHNTAVAWIKKLLNLALEYNCDSSASNQNQQQTTSCTADKWSCANWGTCSPQGIQTRSCNKTFDCSSTETASPATSQYCQAPNRPEPQTPSDDLEITNQNIIIKATVKLLCPVSRTMASQGSGTIIDSDGTILTNKHVVLGTPGCIVGFIDSYKDEPYFGDRHIADIKKISNNTDIAILKLRNPNNRKLTYIDITKGNSNILNLGNTITTYGYPAKFGTTITYTSGDFSGVDGVYLKTTAILEHGNSGGGAYLKNGTYIGIPSAVRKAELNSMGYVLSINTINRWLNNSSMAYSYNPGNRYSRVASILEDINLDALDSLGLYVASESQNVIEEEKILTTQVDNSLTKRISGKILLQVEKNGEGWYVYPDDKKKYYLGRPADAFSIMRNLGLGIKHSELNNYLNAKFPSRLSGKIMLDVEQNGEAYYVNPDDLKGYYLSRPADAFRIMRELGLGITNNDIRKIDVGEID